MSRISTEERPSTTITREMISPETVIRWDPITNTGILMFNVKDLITIGEEQNIVECKRLIQQGMPLPFLGDELSILMQRPPVSITTSDGKTVKVSPETVMLYLKKLFQDLIVEANEAEVIYQADIENGTSSSV